MRTSPLRWLATCAVLFLVPLAAAKPVGWKKIVAPSFTVLTPVDEKDAITWAGDFTQFIEGLHSFIPIKDERLPKLTMVLFGRERDFEAYRPLRADGQPKDVEGFFWRCDSWAIAALPGAYLDEASRRTFFHEGTHWYVSAFDLPQPVWLDEGLAEVFSTFQIEKKGVLWGEGIGDHVVALNQLEPMPVERLLFLSQSDLFTGDSEGDLRTGLAYAQSWALVHYLIFGQTDLPAGALNTYVRLLRTMNPDEAFQTAFGHSYQEMDSRLREYMRAGRYRMSRRKPAPLPAFKVESATADEVELALSQVCLAGDRNQEALEHAQACVAANPELPAGYAMLGRVHQAMDHPKLAREAFEQAVGRHSTDFRPYFEVAAMRHREVMEEDPSGMSFTAADARKIANNYERAINLNPRMEEAYASLAAVLEPIPKPHEQDGAFLALGARLYPDNGMIRIGLAVLDHKAERTEDALKKLADVIGMKSVPGKVRDYAQRLNAAWGQTDAFEQVNALIEAKKFAEARELCSRTTSQAIDPMARMRLQRLGHYIDQREALQRANDAWDARHWTDARKEYEALLETDAPPAVKSTIRRRLEEMTRRKLGVPKTPTGEPPATSGVN